MRYLKDRGNLTEGIFCVIIHYAKKTPLFLTNCLDTFKDPRGLVQIYVLHVINAPERVDMECDEGPSGNLWVYIIIHFLR